MKRRRFFVETARQIAKKCKSGQGGGRKVKIFTKRSVSLSLRSALIVMCVFVLERRKFVVYVFVVLFVLCVFSLTKHPSDILLRLDSETFGKKFRREGERERETSPPLLRATFSSVFNNTGEKLL